MLAYFRNLVVCTVKGHDKKIQWQSWIHPSINIWHCERCKATNQADRQFGIQNL